MAIRLIKEKESSPWLVFTDLVTGLFTVFVFGFLAVWILKDQSEKDLVARNEAFTRKEQEYQSCVEDKRRAQQFLLNYQSLLGEKLKVPIEKGQLVLLDDGKIDIQTHLLFPTGSAAVSAAGDAIIASVSDALAAAALKDTTFIIMVAGHTDDVPISSSNYRSNWELSSDRAMNVMRAMLAKKFPAERLFAAGFGEQHPKMANTSEYNRMQNRRVELVRLNRFQEGLSK